MKAENPQKYDQYRHSKTKDLYVIEGTGLSSTNTDPEDTKMVSYRKLGSSQVWFRTVDEFLGIGSEGKPRFVLAYKAS